MNIRGLLAALLAGALLTGCAQSVDPIERLGKKAAQKVRHPYGPDVGAYRHWGLAAPLAPAPRAAGGLARTAGPGPRTPPVLDHVPTRAKVVFLTYDDPGRNPRFIAMVRELRLPVSLFLTDGAAEPGHAHIARLRALGAGVQNHARVSLRGLPYPDQRTEICDHQNTLRARYGLRPRLFRPPHGEYDRTTLRAAADCGARAMVLWRPWTEGRLHPGDILLARPETTARLLRRVQAEGFTVGRLEDYV